MKPETSLLSIAPANSDTHFAVRFATGRLRALAIPSVALALAVVAASVTAPAAHAVDVFDYCLDHRDQCSFSVNHLTEGWERHLNADRLHVTASTFKVLTLIVYAQAVVDGMLDPGRTISKEDWARFWIGLDGGALARSWEGLGRPDQVTVDQIMRKMIEESDNAAPDWLLNELGSSYFKKVLKKYVHGYHDLPASIGATFISWLGTPDEPSIGIRMLESYSGIEALGYQKEVTGWFKRLRGAEFTHAARHTSCSIPPWEVQDPSCQAAASDLDTDQARGLLGGYFLQSNSRTYNRLLSGILDESLLPSAVQSIVVRHLEWKLEIPEAANLATRLASKGGNLAPQNVCNEVAYARLRETGEQAVVSIFLQNVPVDLSCGEDFRTFEFLEAILLEDGFKQELMNRVPPENPEPELIARFETLKRKKKSSGDQLKTRIVVRNIGTADAEAPFEVWLVVSDDAKANRKDDILEKWVIPFLPADGTATLRFKRSGLEDLKGKYLFVRVDLKQEVAESNEDNDRPWQVLH